MANVSNFERQYCDDNNITIDYYKKNFSSTQKEEIKSEMKAKAEAAKESARIAKESEKEAIRVEREKAKESARIAKESEKEAKAAAKLQKKLDERNEQIASYGDWANGFDFDDKGNIVNSTPNIIYLFENHPAFKNKLSFDEYDNKYLYDNGKEIIYFTDKFYRECQEVKEGFIKGYNPSQTIDALKTVASKRTFNRALNELNNLRWDKKPRLETLFINLLKVEDTPLNRHITKTWIIGAVKRLYDPGTPNENVLILTGGQGVGKSLTLKWLAGNFGFDAAINISSKEQEYGMKLQNCWLCCFDELSGLSKKAAAEYKNWFSLTHDSFRMPYGKTVDDYPRHNAYCATTNDAAFLKDYSDNNERRMWVLECHGTKEDGSENAKLRTDKLWRQIMAEAVYYYKNNPDFAPYLGSKYIDMLAEEQKKFKDFNDDNLGDMLCEVLDRPYILKKNGDIESTDDLIKQIKNGKEYRALYADEKIDYINHISHAAVKRILREVFGTSQKHKYMKAALDGKWCVKFKNTRINGINGLWYVRGNWKNDKEELINMVIKTYDSTAKPSDFINNEAINLSILGLEDNQN